VDKQDHVQLIESSVTAGIGLTSIQKDSAYALLFLGPNKKALVREPVPVVFESPSEHVHVHHGNYHSNAFVHIVRPMPATTTSVEFRRGNKVLVHIDRPKVGPTIKIRSVRTEGRVYGQNEDISMISWDASHPDGANLTYSVSYSPGGGRKWMMVGSGLSSKELAWNLRVAPGSKRALIKVTASDGFNTTSDTSSSFAVEAKAPLVAILPTDQEWPADRPLTLRGKGIRSAGWSIVR